MKGKRLLVLLSTLSSMAIFLNIGDFKSINDANYEVFYNMNILFMGLCTFILYKLYLVNIKKNISRSKFFLAILFSIFMILGEVYVDAGSYSLLFTNVTTVLVTLFKLIGYLAIFRLCFIYLDEFLGKIKLKDKVIKNQKLNWYVEKFEKHPFITSLISILVVWSLYLIAFYPIVLSPDPSFQIRQYYNVPTKYIDWVIQRNPKVFMTAHHPVTQTFLLGWCIDLGRLILNDNFGLFLYTLLQVSIYASVFAYTIKFAYKNNVSRKMCLILLGMYLFVPMYGFYAVSAVKDTLYTSFMILFVLFVYDFINNYKTSKISIKYMIYVFWVMLFLALFRHNGFYVILMTIPFVFFYSKENRVRVMIPFVCFVIVLFGFNKILVPSLGISDGSVREMLSLPFQQTARYVKYHSDELSDEDITTIDYILNYDTLAERYRPEIADPVKNDFNKYTKKKDLIVYSKVWFKGLLHHPETYIDATLNNTFGYFYPNEHNWYIYSTYDTRVTKNNLVKYHFNKLSGLRDFLTVYGNIFPYLPVIGLLSSIGANTWVLLILSVYLIDNKKKKYLIALIPLYGSLLFCIISPVNTYFRYTMPYVFVLPVIIMLSLDKVRGVKNEKK